MPRNSHDRLKNTFVAWSPWGTRFATRAYHEYGYFEAEGRLVAQYLQRPSDVLILGSGNGREARPIRHGGHRITCTDIGSLYLASGQKLFAAEKTHNVAFVQADVRALPFARPSFDFVFFSFYSSLGGKRFEVMNGIRQVLRSGGLVLLTVCTPLYKELNPELDDWIWISDPVQLHQEVSLCGFDLVKSRVDANRPEYRHSILARM